MQPTEPDRQTIEHLAESQRYRLLASDQRRRAIDALADHGTPVSVADLAADVAEAESADDPERVLVTLHHVHLPMLDDAGVVEYDVATRTVYPTG